MRGEFDPIILYHVFQGVVATQSGKASLPCELFYVAADDVVHPVFFEGAILVPNHLEFTVYLPQQKSALDKLEGEVVELEYLKISTNEPGVSIRFQLPPSYLCKHPTANLDDHSRDVQREQIHNFIEGFNTGDEISASEELQHFNQLIRAEIPVVEVFIELVNHFEKPLLEKLVSAELKGLDFELLAHHLSQLVDEELVALELHLLVSLDALVPGRVEEIK